MCDADRNFGRGSTARKEASVPRRRERGASYAAPALLEPIIGVKKLGEALRKAVKEPVGALPQASDETPDAIVIELKERMVPAKQLDQPFTFADLQKVNPILRHSTFIALATEESCLTDILMKEADIVREIFADEAVWKELFAFAGGDLDLFVLRLEEIVKGKKICNDEFEAYMKAESEKLENTKQAMMKTKSEVEERIANILGGNRIPKNKIQDLLAVQEELTGIIDEKFRVKCESLKVKADDNPIRELEQVLSSIGLAIETLTLEMEEEGKRASQPKPQPQQKRKEGGLGAVKPLVERAPTLVEVAEPQPVATQPAEEARKSWFKRVRESLGRGQRESTPEAVVETTNQKIQRVLAQAIVDGKSDQYVGKKNKQARRRWQSGVMANLNTLTGNYYKQGVDLINAQPRERVKIILKIRGEVEKTLGQKVDLPDFIQNPQ